MFRPYLFAVANAAVITLTALPASAAEQELTGDALRAYLIGKAFACTDKDNKAFDLSFPTGDSTRVQYLVSFGGKDYKGYLNFKGDLLYHAKRGHVRHFEVDGNTMYMTSTDDGKNDTCISR